MLNIAGSWKRNITHYCASYSSSNNTHIWQLKVETNVKTVGLCWRCELWSRLHLVDVMLTSQLHGYRLQGLRFLICTLKVITSLWSNLILPCLNTCLTENSKITFGLHLKRINNNVHRVNDFPIAWKVQLIRPIRPISSLLNRFEQLKYSK